MDDILNELQDSLTPDEENDGSQDSINEAASSPEEDEKKKLYARAKKAEERVKQLRDELAKKNQSMPSFSPNELKEVAFLAASGHSKEEIDYMERYAKGSNKTLSEIVSDPFVQTTIEAMRSKRKSEQATPQTSTTPAVEATAPNTTPFNKMNKGEQKSTWLNKLAEQKQKRNQPSFS